MAAEAFLLVVCRIAAPVASSGSAFERRCGRAHDGRGEDHPSGASTPPPSRSRAGSTSPCRDRCRAWAGRSLELGRRRARRPPAQPGPGAEPARRASLEEVADGRAPEHQAVDRRAPKPEEGERAAADHCGHGKSDQESTHGVPPSLERCCPHDAGASSPTGLWPPSGRLQGTLNPVAPRRRAPLRRWDGSSVGPGGWERSPTGPARTRRRCRRAATGVRRAERPDGWTPTCGSAVSRPARRYGPRRRASPLSRAR